MRYIDLTYTINGDTSVSPFDNSIQFKKVKQIDIDQYNDTEITTTMHIGTHIDAPSHMLDNSKTISDYPITKFIGKGVLLDFSNQKEIKLREED